MTDAGSDDYLEMVVDIHNRQFQRYSIENSIYHIPVDEVRHHLVMSVVVFQALVNSSEPPTTVHNCTQIEYRVTDDA